MHGMAYIFRKIDRLSLSTGWIVIIILALLGSLLSYLSYKWIDMAESSSVDLHATTPTDEKNIAYLKPITDRIDVDVVLAIDFSGSMTGDLGSDPNDLRLRAAEIMASTLAADIFPRNTSMGFVEFGRTAIPSGELVSVAKEEDRQKLIQKIYDRSVVAQGSEWRNLTNIMGAMDESDRLLKEIQQKRQDQHINVKNVPAIILMTDGVPTTDKIRMDQIRTKLDELTDAGVLIFVVVLRNPQKEAINTGAFGPENADFAKWREFWFNYANSKNEELKYFEAQNDQQLEGMYNVIRSRLVKEGTHPTDRVEYDPLNSESSIEIPPGILQAHLVVSKPVGVNYIDLVEPDGWKFQDSVQAEPKNKILQGNSFYRFTMYKPVPGNWKLNTDSQKKLYYLLIEESLYTVQPYSAVGKPYLLPDQTSDLAFVIVDDQTQIADGNFEVNVATIKSAKKANGSFGEEKTLLATLHPTTRNGISQYILQVTPELINGKQNLEIQIDGKSDEGTPLNVSLVTIPIFKAPTSMNLTATTPLNCENKKIQIWPPKFICGNTVTITAGVPEGELLTPGSLFGKLYSPVIQEKFDMQLIDPKTVEANISPVESLGSYTFEALVGGKINNQNGDYGWGQRGSVNVIILPPVWAEMYKHRLWYLFILLLVIGLWKPVIVTILLPVFALLKIAPSGYYNNSDDGGPSRIYDRAMERRKLFALTVGKNKKYSDIVVYSSDLESIEDMDDYPRNFYGKALRSLKLWLESQPQSRLIAVPFNGIWCENKSGEFTRAPGGHSYMTCSFDGVQMQVSQDDWHNQD